MNRSMLRILSTYAAFAPRFTEAHHVLAMTEREPTLTGSDDPLRVQEMGMRLISYDLTGLGNGVPVEYLLFEDEGHFLVNRENHIAFQEARLRFLEGHLR